MQLLEKPLSTQQSNVYGVRSAHNKAIPLKKAIVAPKQQYIHFLMSVLTCNKIKYLKILPSSILKLLKKK